MPLNGISPRTLRLRHGTSRKSIGIIGAGPGGLAVAMLLASAGMEVSIFESRDRVGGRSGAIQGRSASGTFHFDQGATFFLYPRILSEIFAACGHRLEDEVDLIRLDPQYRLAFEAGGSIDATASMERMSAEIARLSPHDAAALPRFMEDNRRKLAAFRPVMETAFDSARDLLKPDVLRGLALLRPHRSVDQDLGRYFQDERVRVAFSFQSKYLGMSPFRCPSMFTMLSFLEYEFGVYHPRGGTGAIMEAMARVARGLGVRFHMNEAVRGILFERGSAVGLRTVQRQSRFDALVINSDFAQTMTTLVPDELRRRWSNRRIEAKKFSCSTFMLYLGIEGSLPLLHHTIYLGKNYREAFADIEAGRAPAEPSFYVQNACVTDPDLAPPGHCTLYVLVPVGHRRGEHPDWPREAAAYRERVLDRLERIGVTDIRRRIRFEKTMTPLDWETDLNVYRGATFNLAHNLGQMLHWRPHNRFEDLRNVYLVGGGTHPGSGLPVIFEGARITSRLIAKDLQLGSAGKRQWHEPAEILGDPRSETAWPLN